MTKEQQIEGNKLIAEFMDGKFVDWGFAPSEWFVSRRRICDLLYECSWDWLMPVVEKIEKLGGYVNMHNHLIEFYHSGILSLGLCVFSWKKDGRHFNPKILHVWEGTVEFIKWYNTKKPTP